MKSHKKLKPSLKAKKKRENKGKKKSQELTLMCRLKCQKYALKELKMTVN